MRIRSKVITVVLVILAILGAGAFVLQKTVLKPAQKSEDVSTTDVTVSQGDIVVSVPASGQLEPNEVTTVRPESNLPTRKLEAILVSAGDAVRKGQVLARVDSSGLDLDLESAKATLAAQQIKLADLKAMPTKDDITQADSDLTQAKLTLDLQQSTYNSTKGLVDRGLASKESLLQAEQQLKLAESKLTLVQYQHDQTLAGATEDAIKNQEAAVAQAQNAALKAQLAFDATRIVSPVDGVVAEVLVNVGDLVSPSTAAFTVTNVNPMVLKASVDENDIGNVKVGQTATVSPWGYPDISVRGTVTDVSLRAKTQGNVTVFVASIELPNPDGKLLWGMNADAEITVLEERGVPTLPNTAIQTSNGVSTVNYLDGDHTIPWEIKTGATDGQKTQIVAGLDVGDTVVIERRIVSSSSSSSSRQNNPGGNLMFRALR